MNPLTQFKRILILPLLIALTLVVIAALTAVPARATPACGLNTVILALEHFPSGSLGRLYRPKHVSCGSSHRVAHASGAQPGHGHGGHDYRI